MSNLSMLLKSEIRKSDELSDHMSERLSASQHRLREQEESTAKMFLRYKKLQEDHEETITLSTNNEVAKDEAIARLSAQLYHENVVQEDVQMTNDQMSMLDAAQWQRRLQSQEEVQGLPSMQRHRKMATFSHSAVFLF